MNKTNAPPKVSLLTQLKISYGVKRDYDLKLPFGRWIKIMKLKTDKYDLNRTGNA